MDLFWGGSLGSFWDPFWLHFEGILDHLWEHFWYNSGSVFYEKRSFTCMGAQFSKNPMFFAVSFLLAGISEIAVLLFYLHGSSVFEKLPSISPTFIQIPKL